MGCPRVSAGQSLEYIIALSALSIELEAFQCRNQPWTGSVATRGKRNGRLARLSLGKAFWVSLAFMVWPMNSAVRRIRQPSFQSETSGTLGIPATDVMIEQTGVDSTTRVQRRKRPHKTSKQTHYICFGLCRVRLASAPDRNVHRPFGWADTAVRRRTDPDSTTPGVAHIDAHSHPDPDTEIPRWTSAPYWGT